MDEEATVFERPTPRRAVALTVLTVAAVVTTGGGVGLLLLAETLGGGPSPLAAAAREVFPAVPSADLAAAGTLVVLGVGVLGAVPAVVRSARQRYGRCLIDGDQAVFEPALTSPSGIVVPLAEVRRVRPTPHGLLLDVAGRRPLLQHLTPLLVPTDGEDEAARALARIEGAVDPRPDAEERRAVFGRLDPLPLRIALAGGAVVLPPIVGQLLDHEHIPEVLAVAVALGPIGLLVALLLLEEGVRALRYRRVHVGGRALLVGNERLPWTELTQVALAPPYLAVAAGRRRRLARLGDELPRAAERIRGRLTARGGTLRIEEGAPAWVAADARRRRLLFVGGSFLLAATLLGLAYCASAILAEAALAAGPGPDRARRVAPGDGRGPRPLPAGSRADGARGSAALPGGGSPRSGRSTPSCARLATEGPRVAPQCCGGTSGASRTRRSRRACGGPARARSIAAVSSPSSRRSPSSGGSAATPPPLV